jgi:hypothetical protein
MEENELYKLLNEYLSRLATAKELEKAYKRAMSEYNSAENDMNIARRNILKLIGEPIPEPFWYDRDGIRYLVNIVNGNVYMSPTQSSEDVVKNLMIDKLK